MLKTKSDKWKRLPDGWETVSEEWQVKFKEAYKSNGWTKGDYFTINGRLMNIFPELKDLKNLKGVSYYWGSFRQVPVNYKK